MEAQGAAERIMRGLHLIRTEASRLDSARAEGKSFEAKLALKTIKDECHNLRAFLHGLRDAAQGG